MSVADPIPAHDPKDLQADIGEKDPQMDRIDRLRKKVKEHESKVLEDVGETTKVVKALKNQLEKAHDSKLKMRITKPETPAPKESDLEDEKDGEA